jgi:hypothetical protein
VLSSDGGAPECTYVGAAIVEHGTYSIQASKSGFQTVTVRDVQVRSDSCEADEQPGPSSQQVDISLAPDGRKRRRGRTASPPSWRGAPSCS